MLLVLAAMAVPALSQVVDLGATIRDFNNSDSSFNNAKQNNGGCPGTGYVQSTLGTNRKPIPTHKIDSSCNVGDSLRMANDWFTTDPTYTNSATTCINLPMSVDSTGLYTYNNPSFFPLDTFTTLPNGNPNPFDVTYAGGTPRAQHNFSFCLELHGTFDYKTGQTFNFAGDDDVWFFINSKLEVDLGGVHATENGSVNLDTLGLVAGQTYPWDFFFCERHTTASDILISTTMNLRTTSNFTIQDSALGISSHLYSLWVDQSNASACVATATHSSGLGQFTLTGTGITGSRTLPSGKSYGGITVAQNLGSVVLDSASITGLAPGTYVLHIFQQGSTTSSKDVPFVVPPTFRSLKFTDANGSSINLAAVVTDVFQAVPVYLQAYNDTVPCTTCGDTVTLVAANPLLRILGSANGTPITSVKLVRGKAEVWVESNVPIASTQVTAKSDSASAPAVRSPVTVLAPTLVFLDSTGKILTQIPALEIPLGAKVTVRVELLTSTGAVCTACTDSVALAASTNRLQLLSSSGQPATSILLQGGKATFQLTGWAPVQAGSFSATTYTLQTGATWTPVNVDIGPISGTLMDSNADGQADLLKLTLPVDASAFKNILVSWPDTNGVLQTHAASMPGSGSNLTIGLPPFEFGSTSCPATGCANLGQLVIVHGTDTALVPFPVLDGVVPIPTLAQYRFSATGLSPDTVIVHFSEAVQSSSAAMDPWVSTGRPSADSLGRALTPLSPAWLANDQEAFFLVDSTNGLLNGDSLRISAAPTGALSDLAGNAPGSLAWWTPIVWGQPPVNLSLDVPHPVVQFGSEPVPPQESPITLLIHPDLTQTTVWTAPQGPTPSGLDTRFGGPVVRLNRIPVTLGMYVYDNLGVFVLSQNLSSLDTLISSGVLTRDRRGDYEIWLAWNGKDAKGRDAATGVYTIRVFGWLKDGGRTYLFNVLKKQGLHRLSPN
jgi:fibro-slime domain-containing protein